MMRCVGRREELGQPRRRFMGGLEEEGVELDIVGAVWLCVRVFSIGVVSEME